MWWRKQQSRPEPPSAAEFARRAAVLTRVQLERQVYEGSLSEADFEALVAAHPRSVAQVEQGPDLPSTSINVPRGHLSFYEATSEVLTYVARGLSPWGKTAAELDPLNFGWVAADNRERLCSDVLVSTFVMRNRALYELLDKPFAIQADAQAPMVLLDRVGGDSTAVYDELYRLWDQAVAEREIPQWKVAEWLLVRSAKRSGSTACDSQNPLLQVIVSEKLVNNGLCVWAEIMEHAQLTID